MITFRSGALNGKDTIGLVISNENLVRLVSGEPIVISGQHAGLDPNTQIMIVYKERDEFIAEAEALGLITAETKVTFKG